MNAKEISPILNLSLVRKADQIPDESNKDPSSTKILRSGASLGISLTSINKAAQYSFCYHVICQKWLQKVCAPISKQQLEHTAANKNKLVEQPVLKILI